MRKRIQSVACPDGINVETYDCGELAPYVQRALAEKALAHAGTIMGVESNGMQFYPEASTPEAAVHPGLFRRQGGSLDLSSIRGPGFGYRVGEIVRELPGPAFAGGS